MLLLSIMDISSEFYHAEKLRPKRPLRLNITSIFFTSVSTTSIAAEMIDTSFAHLLFQLLKFRGAFKILKGLRRQSSERLFVMPSGWILSLVLDPQPNSPTHKKEIK